MSDTNILTNGLDLQIESLHAALITDKPPYLAGVCEIPDFTLFYGPIDDAKRIDLSKATEAQLDHLTRTCQAATFGVDQKDVLDETYRKAGKLDCSEFAAKFDIVESGILATVKNELLEGKNDSRPIKAELYKLNVYDKGSFFKTHKDTPRAESMFGSVVVVFPTPHIGGALVLRQNGRSWTFDSATEVSRSPVEHPVIGYVAFYSDVDHEVTEVTSGHRVTLTFNLYFDETERSGIVPIISEHEKAFREKLQGLLSDETLKLKLGFGLTHQYPVKVNGDLQSLFRYLKGSDALIGRVCSQIGLNCYLRVMYDSDDEWESIIMVDRVVDLSGWGQMEESLAVLLLANYGGVLVNPDAGTSEDEDYSQMDQYGRYEMTKVEWVTPLTAATIVETQRIAYGNEASLETLYGKICLIVEIGTGQPQK